MKQIIMKTLAATLMIGAVSGAAAQELRSSYFMKTSTYRHQMNPALLDEAYVGMPFLGNINVGASGNVGLKNFIYKLEGNPEYDLTTFMSPTVSANEFLGDLSSKNRMNVNVNYNIFSVAFKAFQGINLVELNLRSNTMVSLPYELFDFMKTAGEQEHYSLENLGVRSSNYMELAFGHSHVINDKLTVGGKLKFLFGAAYADLDVKRMDLTLNENEWVIDADAELTAAVLKSDFKYSDSDDPNKTQEGKKKVEGLEDVKFGIPGFGMALDLGAVYKVMDGLTVSGGITDLGFISWSNANKALSSDVYTFDGFKNPIYMGGTNTGDNKIGDQFEALGDDLEKFFSFYDQGKGSKTTGLAATINLGAEYEMPFYRNLSAGFLYTSRIQGLYSWHQGMLSANVRPLKWLEASLNTSVASTGWCFGGMLSFHPKGFNFFIGSDRFLGKVSKEFIPLNSLNANVALGFNFPLN